VSQAAVDIWPLVSRPDDAAVPPDTDAVHAMAKRFARFASPVLAEHLLAPVAARLGRRLIDEADCRASRLGNRFNLAQQRHWAAEIVGAGIEVAFLKGFANAHTLYPDSELRTQGDLDLLVREAARDRLIDLLSARGFRFRASRPSPWGMISDASYLPFVSVDGACNVDIHIQPDAWPAYRSLDAARLFARTREVTAGELAIRVPCPEHVLVLCVTNAAKDKFGPFSVRKVIDAIVLLRGAPALDWDEVLGLARDGGFAKPMRGFFLLLARLDLPPAAMAGAPLDPLDGLAGRELDRVAAEFRALFPDEAGAAALLRREIALSAEPSVAARNLWRRVSGLIRPRPGLPPGIRLDPAQRNIP